MEVKQEYSLGYILERFSSMLEDKDSALEREEIRQLQRWLLVYLNRFERHQVNHRLQQYATGEKKSMLFEQRIA